MRLLKAEMIAINAESRSVYSVYLAKNGAVVQ
jgi:hypothetical protein